MLSVLMHEDRKRVTLRFAHPKGNVITDELVAQLRQALDDLSQSTSLRLLMIEGEGRDFSFGANIPEHAPGAIETSLPLQRAAEVLAGEQSTGTFVRVARESDDVRARFAAQVESIDEIPLTGASPLPGAVGDPTVAVVDSEPLRTIAVSPLTRPEYE